MKKSYWPLIYALLAIYAVEAQVPAVTLAGSSQSSALFVPNAQTWISGTITITKNDPTVSWVTVDLNPKATSPGNSRKFRQEWTNVVTNVIQKIDVSQIYFSQSTGSPIIYMWGSDGDGGTGVTASNVFSYQFPAGSPVGTTISFPYYVMFQNAATPAPGTYERLLTFRARLERFAADNSTPLTTPVTSLIVRPSFVVSPQGEIKLYAGTAGTTELSTLAFGTITGITTTQQFRISVISNYRYSVSVTSRRGGFFFHEIDQSLPAGATPTIEPIPYSFSLSGVLVALSSAPRMIVEYAPPTGSVAVEKTAAITIGDVSDYTAGKYSDYFSFVMTAM